MGTNEYSQPASKSSWDGQDFGDVKMVVKMAHFHKSSRPQWVKRSMYVATHVAIQEYYVMFTYCFGLCDHTPTRVGHMGRLDSLRPSGAYMCQLSSHHWFR